MTAALPSLDDPADPFGIGPSARDALRSEIHRMDRDELEKIAYDAAWTSRQRRLRAAATLDTDVTEEQLTLFKVGSLLSHAVRFINDDGDEDFKSRDMASFREHIENEQYNLTVLQSKTGRQERKLQRIVQFVDEQPPNFDDEAPSGQIIYADVICAICGNGWSEDNPFEKAHDIAVVAGGGDHTVRWAHRSCNHSEGVG